MHLAARLPAAVLAEVLNLTPGTAVEWVRAAGGDWASYAAEVARARDRAGRSFHSRFRKRYGTSVTCGDAA